MSEEEVIKRLEDLIDTCNKGIEMHPYDKELFETDKTALETVLQLLEQKDNKIKELNKGINTLMTKRKKWKNRYYKINADLYSANKIIDDYIEERKKLIDKMIGDKMEQFDDYIIYLIESYLEILGE